MTLKTFRLPPYKYDHREVTEADLALLKVDSWGEMDSDLGTKEDEERGLEWLASQEKALEKPRMFEGLLEDVYIPLDQSIYKLVKQELVGQDVVPLPAAAGQIEEIAEIRLDGLVKVPGDSFVGVVTDTDLSLLLDKLR